MLHVYGHYLLNGGRPEDFMKLTHDDIQIMYIVMQSESARSVNNIAKLIASMFGMKER